MTSTGDHRRKSFEHDRMMLLWMIVDSLPTDRMNLAELWSPPMTAEGRHMVVARDIEKWLQAVWQTKELDTRPGYQPPASHYQAALKRVLESDEAFVIFPPEAHEGLRRIRELLDEVVEAGLA